MGHDRCYKTQVVIISCLNRRRAKNCSSKETGWHPQLVHWTPFRERKGEAGGGGKGSEVILTEAFEAGPEPLIPRLACSCVQSLRLSYPQCQNPRSHQKPHTTQPSRWSNSMPPPNAGFPPRSPSS